MELTIVPDRTLSLNSTSVSLHLSAKKMTSQQATKQHIKY